MGTYYYSTTTNKQQLIINSFGIYHVENNYAKKWTVYEWSAIKHRRFKKNPIS